MTRILAGAAFVTILMGSASAFAATTAPAHTAAVHVDYAARCTSLSEQWKTAEAANASHKSLGKAKADAARAAKYCKSNKVASEKKGTKKYEAALKLLGVTPSV